MGRMGLKPPSEPPPEPPPEPPRSILQHADKAESHELTDKKNRPETWTAKALLLETLDNRT